MVSFRPHGRMGNFLYMAAHTIGYAKKHGLEYSMPNSTNDHFWNPIYFPHLIHPNFIKREDILINENWNAEQHYNEYEFKEEWRGKNIVFNGYNQSYKYWDFCREEMLKDFGFPWELNEWVCSIHCRRGDYLKYPNIHPVITIDYLRQAVEIMHFKGIRKFKFHSDDIPWCQSCGLAEMFPDCEFTFSIGKNEVEDLISMSECSHQIASNSTLSLWGAELNRNPNKVVIVPAMKNWFGPDNKLSVKDLYRPEWIQVSYDLIFWTKDKGFVTV